MVSVRSMKFVMTAGTALFLVGCAGQYSSTELQGTAFTKHLYHGYSDLAAAEKAEGDRADAEYFMAKAAQAAGGEAVAETSIKERELQGDNKIQAMIARAKLDNLMYSQDAAKTYPGSAAKLQVAYDCYLQELEEGIQPADIQACKDAFDVQVARLEEMMKPGAQMIKMVKATPEPVAVPGPFNIYFGLDSAEIDANYMKTVRIIAKSAMEAEVTKVMIHGHTDLSGDSGYNSTLGLRRAMSVQRALRANGLDGVRMSVSTEGERNPQVETADGTPERLNRRVQILLSR